MIKYFKRAIRAWVYITNKSSGNGAPIMGNNIVDVIHSSMDSAAMRKTSRWGEVEKIDITVHGLETMSW